MLFLTAVLFKEVAWFLPGLWDLPFLAQG